MPLDQPPTPDITTPAGLVQWLREPWRWPVGFRWDFSQCPTCAMGLLRAVSGKNVWDIPELEAAWSGGMFWCGTYPVPDRLVTPAMVADRIDAYLARQAA